ncbi:MAG TPA: monofunctional biosynthetic peptidoglycan transglycosylase [Candidatus Methylomirabilis sp.]|nr:monofunctional biosynthetic peptidoglycan transglycosylase [Candidatus Methylomirabilis sp.]
MRTSSAVISVVIPVYNAERYLAQALESVTRQTCSAREILVIDDGSTDGSGEVARRYPNSGIRVVWQPNGGPAAARNHGVRLVGGEFLAFLDADDLWEPRKLELQLEALRAHPAPAMVFGELIQVRNGCDPQRQDLVPCGDAMGAPSVGTLLIRTQDFHRVGFFDTRWRVGEFIDWYARARDLGLEEILVPQVVLKRRLHDDNLGVRERAARQEYARVIASAVARRRDSGPAAANLDHGSSAGGGLAEARLAAAPSGSPDLSRSAESPSRPRWRWLRGAPVTLALLAAVAMLTVGVASPVSPIRVCLAALAAVFLASAVPVLALRWIRPPITTFMIWARRRRGRGPAVHHEWVPYEAVAPSMRLAAIGAEDVHFVSHAGFDWPSIRRAARHNREGGPQRGASTISQQVAKNLFLWPGRSYLRKAVEAYFTVLIEAMWSKRRILEVYLNIAQFGPDIFGVGAASRILLGKDVASLSPQDAALLAAVLPNPDRYDARRPAPAVRLRQVMIMDSVRRLDLDPDRL